jgi:hypothetical protein
MSVSGDKIMFDHLSELGAGEFEHLDGTLERHLVGVHELLAAWGAHRALRRAGLFHAAYGTSGFTEVMVSLKRRSEIAGVIGSEAERIVYDYCACDRAFVWPQFGLADALAFRDRFTGLTRWPTGAELHEFCQLTCANEVEIALRDAEFVQRLGPELSDLFDRMQPWLSQTAYRAAQLAFSRGNP